MRQHLLDCLQNHKLKPFPRLRTLTGQVPPVDITKDIDSTQKWVTPRKHAKKTHYVQITLAMILVPKISTCF